MKFFALALLLALGCSEAVPPSGPPEANKDASASPPGDSEVQCPDGQRSLQSDIYNCGGCGRVCTVPSGGSVACVGGVCVGACPPRSHPCDSGPRACFRDDDPEHCAVNGQCVRCDAPTGGVATCAGACVQTCPSPTVLVGTACVDPRPPRNVAPLSGTATTAPRPTLRLEVAAHTTGASVTVWRDRDGRDVVWRGTTANGEVMVGLALPPGDYWWAARSLSNQVAVGTQESPRWHLRVVGDVAPLRQGAVALPEVVDFNGDGHMDVPLREGAQGRVQVVTGPLDVDAPRRVEVAPTAPFPAFDGAATGDVNGDGYTDLLVFHRATRAVGVIEGTRAGLPRSITQTLALPGAIATAVVAGDVTGDGVCDLLALGAAPPAATARIYVASGAARGMAFRTADVPFAGDPAVGLAVVGDVNGDGRHDVAVWSSNAVVLLRGTDDGVAARPFATIAAGDVAAVAGVGDSAGDGWGDLLIVRAPAGSPPIAEQYPGGAAGLGPAPAATLALSAGRLGVAEAFDIRHADLNHDGRDDLVLGRPAADEVQVSLGTDRGLVSLSQSVAGDDFGAYGSSVWLLEANGDDAIDLVVGAPDAVLGAGRAYLYRGASPYGGFRRALVFDGESGAHLGAAR